jgi:threonine 3-dehydrogenase
MKSTMLALVYDKNKQPWEQSKGLRLAEVPTPVMDESKDPHDRDMVLIKTRYAGFCGSDRGIWFRRAFKDMIYDSLNAEHKTTRVIGHELLGEVVTVGSAVAKEYGYKAGDIVSTESHLICGTCYQCRAGNTHVCITNRIIGISSDGCFAEYVKLPAQALWATNTDIIRPEVGALQEPFGNAVHACTKVDLKGKTVAIVGCGTIGLFAIAIAKAMGARLVIGIEPIESHIKMAKALGADHVIAPTPRGDDSFVHDEAISQQVRALTEGHGVDVALEMSGSNAALNTAIASVCRGGDVILFGLKSGDAVIENFDRLIVDGISLHSVVGRRIFETWNITKSILEGKDPNIHDRVMKVILNNGVDTIINFESFEPAAFEQKILTWPKVVFKFA